MFLYMLKLNSYLCIYLILLRLSNYGLDLLIYMYMNEINLINLDIMWVNSAILSITLNINKAVECMVQENVNIPIYIINNMITIGICLFIYIFFNI